MAKFCVYCGKEIDGNTQFCPNCGAKNDSSQSQANNVVNNVPSNGFDNNTVNNNSYNYNSGNVQPTNNGYSNGIGIAGFVISLVSLIMCCGSLSWLSIIFSIIGINKAKQHNGAGQGISVAGLVISIIGLLIFLFYFSAIIVGVAEGISEVACRL